MEIQQHYAVNFRLFEILKYLLSQKAGLFFGWKIPLVKACEEYHYAFRTDPVESQTQKACLNILTDATFDYFYQMALRFTGTEQELVNEFEQWVNYISEMGRRSSFEDYRARLRAFLYLGIFNPLYKRLEKEKSQRLAFCMLGRREFIVANSPYHHVISDNQTIDKGILSEIFAHVYGVASRTISVKDKFNGALIRAL